MKFLSFKDENVILIPNTIIVKSSNIPFRIGYKTFLNDGLVIFVQKNLWTTFPSVALSTLSAKHISCLFIILCTINARGAKMAFHKLTFTLVKRSHSHYLH